MTKRLTRNQRKKNDTSASVCFEAQLRAAANALRDSMDAAECKDVLLGLVFMKYVSEVFEGHRTPRCIAKLMVEMLEHYRRFTADGREHFLRAVVEDS